MPNFFCFDDFNVIKVGLLGLGIGEYSDFGGVRSDALLCNSVKGTRTRSNLALPGPSQTNSELLVPTRLNLESWTKLVQLGQLGFTLIFGIFQRFFGL